jgi:hypothetical protein
MGYVRLRLLKRRLLTYSRPMKYPAASRTITTRISRDAGEVLCIIGEYICNGTRCQAERATSVCTGEPESHVGCKKFDQMARELKA